MLHTKCCNNDDVWPLFKSQRKLKELSSKYFCLDKDNKDKIIKLWIRFELACFEVYMLFCLRTIPTQRFYYITVFHSRTLF